MLPFIKNGDKLYFIPTKFIDTGDVVLYKSWNNKTVCHRIIKINNYITTKGDNCRYKDIKIKRSDIIGKIINIKSQKYKKILTLLSITNILKILNKGESLWKIQNG